MVSIRPSFASASVQRPVTPSRQPQFGQMGAWHLDMGKVSAQAFVLSSFIQVLSRVYVANRSAKEAKGTPDAYFRYQEAVKTTFREIPAWVLSYFVLRRFSGFAKSAFKVGLGVKGLSGTPSFFEPLMAAFFKTGRFQWVSPVALGRGFINTHATSVRNLFQNTKAFFGFNAPKTVEQVFNSMYQSAHYTIDPVRGQHINSMKWINKGLGFIEPLEKAFLLVPNLFRRLVGLKANVSFKPLSDSDKIAKFFDWIPALIGSIPAVFLSGYCLERFTRDYSGQIAVKLAKRLDQENPNVKTLQQYVSTLDPNERPAYAYGTNPWMSNALLFQSRYPVAPYNPPLYWH